MCLCVYVSLQIIAISDKKSLRIKIFKTISDLTRPKQEEISDSKRLTQPTSTIVATATAKLGRLELGWGGWEPATEIV